MNVELFGCSGGMAEGFRRAGIEFDLVVDKDPDACASYLANMGKEPLRVDVHELARLARAGWKPGPVGLLVADPPCTPWSRAGKRRGTADERDCLKATCELIAILKPERYLVGNVPGLQDSTHWHVVQDLIGGLARCGYCAADYALLDAAAYGVPQHRKRPFWFGHLAGPCIRWPAPSHWREPASLAFPGFGLAPFVTVSEALAGFSPDEVGRPVTMELRHPVTGVLEASEPGRPGKFIGTKKRPPSTKGPQWSRVSRANEPAPTVLTDTDRRTGNGVKVAWPWPDRPSTTVCAGVDTVGQRNRSGGGRDGTSQSTDAIVLSERAAARLQGFPPGWRFQGASKRSRWSQIGQATPPPLAEAIARAVVEQAASTVG